MRQLLALQDQGEVLLFIADLHALTTLREPSRLAAFTRDVALDYLALGLDPAKATLFRQSDVSEVTELAWILAIVTGTGLLERAHAYKDKLAHGLPASAGLFLYPILMASDILYALVAASRDVTAMADGFRAGAMGYGEAKRRLVTAIDARFGDARTRREALAPDLVDDVLRAGANRARAIARETMARVRDAIGLLG